MSGELRLSMLFKAETAQARAAISGLRAETDTLGASAAKAGREAAAGSTGLSTMAGAGRATAADFERLAASGEDVASILNALRAVANPLVGEYLSLQQSIAGVVQAEDLGILTHREAALAIDQLTRAQNELRPAIAAGGGAIEANTAAVIEADTALQRLIATTTGMASAEGESVAVMLQRGQALDALRARFDPLFATSRAYELELEQIAEAERQGAVSAGVAAQARARAAQQLARGTGEIANASKVASFHLTGLGYQVNDILTMIVSGQNPFILAAQQGTQVTQVFQAMKREGQALGPAIRGALLSMISPISLVTMGVIALGAFAVQALVGLQDKTVTAEEAVKAMEGSVRSFGQEAGKSASDVVRDFGAISTATVDLQRKLTDLAQTKALIDLHTTLKSLKADLGDGAFQTGAGKIGELLGVAAYDPSRLGAAYAAGSTGSPGALRNALGGAVSNDVQAFQASLDALGSAKGPAAQVKIVQDLEQQLVRAAGGIDQMTAAQATYYGQLLDTEVALNRIVADQAKARQQAVELARAAGSENARMGGPLAIDVAKPRDPAKDAAARASAQELLRTGREEIELARLKAVYGAQSAEVRAEEARQAAAAVESRIRELGLDRSGLEAQRLRGQAAVKLAQAEAARVAEQRKSAADTIAQYQAQARINELTARYGADSLEVAYARASAERDVVAAQIEAQGYTGQTAADLLQAWDAANGIAAVNMAAGIGAAAAEAQLLAANLGISLQQAVNIMGLAGHAKQQTASRVSWGGGSALGGLGNGTALTYGATPGSGPQEIDWPSPKAAKKGGGAKAEANAVQELIASEREQISVLKILDPVQAEIEKNHKALAGATGAERAEVGKLIAERMRLQQIRDAIDEIGQTGKNAFTGLVSGANSLRDALVMVIEKLADMAASSAWDALWNGGLSGLIGGLFGGSGGTGNYGLPLPFADGGGIGGQINGPGGPRDDRILIRASAGEYMINAAATAANRPLIEAINGGASVHELLAILSNQAGHEVGQLPLARALDGGAALSQLIGLVGSRTPAYADGGLIGSSAPSGWRVATGGDSGRGGTATGSSQSSGEAGLDVRLYVDQGGNWQAEVERISAGVAASVTKSGIEQFSRRALPGRVAQISADPRAV